MAMKHISVQIPDSIAENLPIKDDDLLASIAQEAFWVRLYAMGTIDLDSLSEVLDMGYYDLRSVFEKYGIAPPDEQLTAEDTAPSEHNGEPTSEREKIRAVLREAGLLVDFSEYPELKKRATAQPRITREEAKAIFARHPGKPLSEIVIEQRERFY